MLDGLNIGAQLSIDAALKLLEGMSPEQLKEVEQLVDEHTSDFKWVPNPGPQTMAYFCEADELLFGGGMGGGKSQVLIGKALQRHKRSTSSTASRTSSATALGSTASRTAGICRAIS